MLVLFDLGDFEGEGWCYILCSKILRYAHNKKALKTAYIDDQ